MQKILGETKFNVNDLINGAKEFRLQNMDNSGGIALLKYFNILRKPSFLEYITGGI